MGRWTALSRTAISRNPALVAASLCVVALLALTGCTSSGSPFLISPSSTTISAGEPWLTLKPGQALRFRPVLVAVPAADESGSALAAKGLPASTEREFLNLTCAPHHTNLQAGQDNAALPLATCDQAGQTKYLLGPLLSDGTTTLDGAAISGATATHAQSGTGYVVGISFTRAAATVWAGYTASHVGQQIAIVLDSTVVSAPTIEEAMPTGQAQISGEFTQQEAQDLAGWLNGH